MLMPLLRSQTTFSRSKQNSHTNFKHVGRFLSHLLLHMASSSTPHDIKAFTGGHPHRGSKIGPIHTDPTLGLLLYPRSKWGHSLFSKSAMWLTTLPFQSLLPISSLSHAFAFAPRYSYPLFQTQLEAPFCSNFTWGCEQQRQHPPPLYAHVHVLP